MSNEVVIDYHDLKSRYLADVSQYLLSAGMSSTLLILYWICIKCCKKLSKKLGFTAVKYGFGVTVGAAFATGGVGAAAGAVVLAAANAMLFVDTLFTVTGFIDSLLSLGNINIDKTGITNSWLEKFGTAISTDASPINQSIYLSRSDIALLVLATSHYSNAKVSEKTATAFRDLWVMCESDVFSPDKPDSSVRVVLNWRYKANKREEAKADFDDFLRDTYSSLNAIRKTYSWKRTFELPVNVLCTLLCRSKIPGAAKLVTRLTGIAN